MPTPIELRQERRSLVQKMRDLVDFAEAEKRDLTPLELEHWDKVERDEKVLTERIERAERLDALSKVDVPEPRGLSRESASVARDPEFREKAFSKWLRSGVNNLDVEERAALGEQRALAVGTDSAGGYTVSKIFDTTLRTNMLAYGSIMNVVTRLPTETGAQLLIPTSDDTSNVGAILAENAAVSEQDVVFAQTTIDTYVYSSKLIKVSYQLLQDTFFPLESWLAERLGERLGRILNTHLTTGDGSSKPYGVVAGATVGKTGAAGQTTTILYDDIVDLEHSLDPAYRNGAQFMMNDAMLKTIKKLKDTTGLPLWNAGLAGNAPNTIMGYPYTINQDVAVPAASAKSLLFGNFNNYMMREVQGITVIRLTERYADYLQQGFMAWGRWGGRLISAGTVPIKFYAHPAS